MNHHHQDPKKILSEYLLDFCSFLADESKKNFLTLVELFYPPHCDGCGKAIFEKSRLCTDCWKTLTFLSKNTCPICSYHLNSSNEIDMYCENCANRQLNFVAGVSTFSYQGLVRKFISQFKYRGDQILIKVLAELLRVTLQDERLAGIHFQAIVPVPLHRNRERERGFNQARLLANEAGALLGCHVHDLLFRREPTVNQVHSDRSERIKNLKGAFKLKKNIPLSGNYLLIDDVLTTGATLDECAEVLRRAGADGVWAVTVARS